VLHAAWRIEREGARAAREEISLIKFTVARTLQRVLDRAIQGLGGLGMTDDTPPRLLVGRTSARRASTTVRTRFTRRWWPDGSSARTA